MLDNCIGKRESIKSFKIQSVWGQGKSFRIHDWNNENKGPFLLWINFWLSEKNKKFFTDKGKSWKGKGIYWSIWKVKLEHLKIEREEQGPFDAFVNYLGSKIWNRPLKNVASLTRFYFSKLILTL